MCPNGLAGGKERERAGQGVSQVVWSRVMTSPWSRRQRLAAAGNGLRPDGSRGVRGEGTSRTYCRKLAVHTAANTAVETVVVATHCIVSPACGTESSRLAVSSLNCKISRACFAGRNPFADRAHRKLWFSLDIPKALVNISLGITPVTPSTGVVGGLPAGRGHAAAAPRRQSRCRGRHQASPLTSALLGA